MVPCLRALNIDNDILFEGGAKNVDAGVMMGGHATENNAERSQWFL